MNGTCTQTFLTPDRSVEICGGEQREVRVASPEGIVVVHECYRYGHRFPQHTEKIVKTPHGDFKTVRC